MLKSLYMLNLKLIKMLKDSWRAFLKRIFVSLILIGLFSHFLFGQDQTDTTAIQQTDQAEAAPQQNGLPSSEEAIQEGATLYQNDCTVCHQIHAEVVGPALAGITERRPIPWLIRFIRNSQQVIQEGDEYAVELYNQYNKTLMPSFDYSDEEIKNILAYIQQESQAPEAAADTDTGELEAADGEQAADGVGLASEYVNIVLIVILVVLVLILIVLALIISVLTKYLNERKDLTEEQKEEIKPKKVNVKKVMTSKPMIGLFTFIFVAIAFKAIIDSLFTIGVYEGYAPEQPVWFSHKIHAGQYQIDCNYCHTSAYESQSANIPSVNVCMNCHNPQLGGIVEGTVTGTTEINKVIAAYQNQEPIEWVRVHNLPDLAIFPHAVHTEVGGIECQTCHGEVETMDVITQVSDLTMGWCIDCHRTTNVNAAGNEYYDKLVQIHEEVSDQPLTVEDLGGTECARCHY